MGIARSRLALSRATEVPNSSSTVSLQMSVNREPLEIYPMPIDGAGGHLGETLNTINKSRCTSQPPPPDPESDQQCTYLHCTNQSSLAPTLTSLNRIVVPTIPARFQEELSCPHSTLYTDFIHAFQTNQKPRFTDAQVIALALLAQPDRTTDVDQILRWVSDNFGYYNGRDGPSGNDLYARVRREQLKTCLIYELYKQDQVFEADFVREEYYMSKIDAEKEDDKIRSSKWLCNRSAATQKYVLPVGQEDVLFKETYNSKHDAHFAKPYDIPPDNGICFADKLPPELWLQIFKHLFQFDEALHIGDGTAVAPVIPPRLQAYSYPKCPALTWKLPTPRIFFASFTVNKKFYELARHVFYGQNTFLLHDTRHKNMNPFLRRIGNNIHLLRRVELHIAKSYGGMCQNDVWQVFALLGRCEALRSLTLKMDSQNLWPQCYVDVRLTPGFRTLARYRGIVDLKVLGCRLAREYLEEVLTPWKKYERKLRTLMIDENRAAREMKKTLTALGLMDEGGTKWDAEKLDEERLGDDGKVYDWMFSHHVDLHIGPVEAYYELGDYYSRRRKLRNGIQALKRIASSHKGSKI